MRKSILIISILLLAGLEHIQAQDSILVWQNYIDIVKSHHPFVYRGDINIAMADAGILKARGAFDPKIEGGYQSKQFDNTNYYRMLQGGLKLPLWFGSDLKLRFDRNNGAYLNNSDFVPEQGLLGPGIDLVLGKGLFTDSRRATLQKAKIVRANSELLRSMLINDLLYDASKAYFYFQETSLTENLLEESVRLAEIRFQNTIDSYLNGYTSAVDTLESRIELQNRQRRLLQLQQDRQNSLAELGNYLWINGRVPVELESYMRSDSLELETFLFRADSLAAGEDEILASHPSLMAYDNKRDIYEIERKLNRENLKPELQLSYSPLIDFDNQINNGSLFFDNYKMGAYLSYPIFTRKERGELRITELQMEDLGYERLSAVQKLKVQARISRNSMANYREQLEQIQRIREDSKALLDAENLKFSIGESSVFLVNSREQKYIQARQKEIELRVKLLKVVTDYLYTLNKMDTL